MKILFVTLALFVALCQARASSRRNAAMIQSQDDLINEGAGLYHMNPNPNYNMVHHQTSVITGQLSIRVEELVSYLLEKLETLKDFFDRLEWETLSEYVNKMIDFLKRYEDKVPNSDEQRYSNRFLGTSSPRRS